MAQEFVIKSPDIEDKINQLLPSQGGFQAGVDFSASTMVVPIIDLTETAEGSNVRVDLQTALSLTSVSSFLIENTTTVIANTPGYYRVFGGVTINGTGDFSIQVSDGTTTKNLLKLFGTGTSTASKKQYDFIVFIKAGEEIRGISGGTGTAIVVTTRQIADVNGNLVNP